MRKIEQEMVMAAKSHRDWRLSNTETRRCIGCTRVYLHGNEIAKVMDTGRVVPNIYTLREWDTNTTRSRLWALGVDVQRIKGVTHVDGNPI